MGKNMRVLQGFDFGEGVSTENPYIELFVNSLPAPVISLPFSWRAAFLSRYDVVHVHWPEYFTRASRRLRWMKFVVFALLLLRWRIVGTRIVRTLHNEAPHEKGPVIERFLLERLDRMTDEWIVMNSASGAMLEGSVSHIPHGHYRDVIDPRARRPVLGQLLYFGLIREYKGVDDLIEVVRASPGVSSMRVMGAVRNASLRDRIVMLSSGDDRIHLELAFVSDDELADAMSTCAAVILPYHNFTNSGSLLLALSMSCPVIVPRVPTTIELQREFGSDWVVLYDPPLSAEKLTLALSSAHLVDPTRVVDMSAREWERLGSLTASVYHAAMSTKGARRRSRQPSGFGSQQ